MIKYNKKILLVISFLIGYFYLIQFNYTYAELDWATCTSPTKAEVSTYVYNHKNDINAVNTFIKPYIKCIHSDEYDYDYNDYIITTIDTSNNCFIMLKNDKGIIVHHVTLIPQWELIKNPNPNPPKSEIEAEIFLAAINHTASWGKLNSWKLLHIINSIRKPSTDSYIGKTSCYTYEDHKYITLKWEWSDLITHCNNWVDGEIPSPSICTCQDWSSEWSVCDASSYSWTKDTISCKDIRKCVQNKIWTSTQKLCSQWCNAKWLPEQTETTVEFPYDCSPTCWTRNTNYTYDITEWPAWTIFCASGSSITLPSPSFPNVWQTVTWTCNNWWTSTWCTASRWTWPYCWDWKQDSWEVCDLWALNGIWNCTTSCTIPWSPPTLKYCWDWTTDHPNSFNFDEKCDDHNNISWDWCSSTCTEENNPPPTGWWYCWDWERQGSEACDDGNYINNDFCTNICTEPHASHPWEKSYCWDWKKQYPNDFWFYEACDDWDINNNNTCTNNCTEPHNSLPWEWGITTSGSCDLTSSGYANNSEINSIYATLTINADIDWKDVINLWTPINFRDLSNNPVDRVNWVWNSSLDFEWISIDWDPTWWTTQKIKIATVTSKTPFTSCGNKISFELMWKTMVLSNIWYNFKKPYIWELKASIDWWVHWDTKPSIWTKLRYKLSALSHSSLTNYSLELWVSNISHSWANITLQNTKLMNYAWVLSRKFETRINSSIYATELNKNPWLQVILPVISYTLGWETVRYYLSAYDYGNDKTPITLNWDKFLWVKIIWWLQWAWKYEFTGQNKNISNLYPSDLRTQIRKRAYDYISSMSGGTIINKVKYVNWNITLSWSQDYETLVVKNGNVTINWNLNTSGTSGKKLWIIVLKDNYNTSIWYNWSWNVLVTPNVKKINAMIYADGWFMSADNDWKIYATDSTERTNDLQKQLIMNWVMFTRNTIWWAQFGWVKNGWTYILPGWTKTQSFDKAMVYDLNYIRRWNDWCDNNTIPNWCKDAWEYEEWFIIKYDSRIQTDPPKLFYK